MHFGAEVRRLCGEDLDTYASHVAALVAGDPQITLDDGADLVSVLHATRPEAVEAMFGGTEETTTGLLAACAGGGGPAALPDPGGQRGAHRARVQRPLRHRPVDLDGILRATNLLLAGRTLVVVGLRLDRARRRASARQAARAPR